MRSTTICLIAVCVFVGTLVSSLRIGSLRMKLSPLPLLSPHGGGLHSMAERERRSALLNVVGGSLMGLAAGGGLSGARMGWAADSFKLPSLESGYNPRNERIYDTSRRSFLPARPEQFLQDELTKKNKKIVVIGEVHSNPCHHHAEFEILRTLYNSYGTKGGVAIGLECFYRQHQKALDRFIFKHQDISILKEETAWKETWGFDLNYYAKIFKYAATHGIRLIGLNVPVGVARLVGEVGIDNVPTELGTLLPALDLSNKKHRTRFVNAITGGGGAHNIDPKKIQYLYEAQTLWEEYMSESAASYIRKYPDEKLLVIAGVGHVAGRAGIPDRIEARVGFSPFVIVPQVVKWSEESGLPDVETPLGRDEGDWAWYTEYEILS